MKYEIYLDGKILFYTGDEKYTLIDPVLTEALNDACSFEFKIAQTNPMFNEFHARVSLIKILKDGTEIFYGRVMEVDETLDFVKRVYCVGVMGEMFNTIQPQAKYQNVTPTQMLSYLLLYHNNQIGNGFKFYVGAVTVTDPNDSIYRYTNYEDTLTAIREKMCNTLDGYIKLRRKDSTSFYIDFVTLETYGRTVNQPIEFGRNLLKYSSNLTAQDIATSVVPLGARLEEPTSRAVEGLDEYLTIVGTSTDAYHKNTNDNFVQIDEAVNTYGTVRVVKHWDNVTVANNLKTKAENWLRVAQYEKLNVELSAVDLSILNSSIDSYEVGDLVRVKATSLGLDTTMPVQKKTTNLNDLSKNTISLGSTMQKSYTQKVNDSATAILGEIPETMTVLQTAKKNASDLINGMLGNLDEGNMRLVTGEDGHITEIVIADNPVLESAVKVWRWNINGLGYSSNGYNGTYATAITMDGKINAAMVLANKMVADMIQGGTLSIGGMDNKYGVVSIKDGSNNEIGVWNKDGISVSNGSFKSKSTDKYTKLTNGKLEFGSVSGSTETQVASLSHGYSASAKQYCVGLFNGNAEIMVNSNIVEMAHGTNMVYVNDDEVFIGVGGTDQVRISAQSGGILLEGDTNFTIEDGSSSGMSTEYHGYDGEITYRKTGTTTGTLVFKKGLLVDEY